AQGGGGGDPRSDVYSAGCVLYEMLTGRMAFGGVNLREVLAKQAAGTPTPMPELRPEGPPAGTTVVNPAPPQRPGEREPRRGDLGGDLGGGLGEPGRLSTPNRGPPADWPGPASERASSGSRLGYVLMGVAALLLLALVVSRFLGGNRGTAPPEGADAHATIAV